MARVIDYPLYASLDEAAKTIGVDRTKLRSVVNGLPAGSEHLDIIYSLIHHHHRTTGAKGKIAYGGRLRAGNRGVLYSRLDSLPEELIKIICAYVVTYIE